MSRKTLIGIGVVVILAIAGIAYAYNVMDSGSVGGSTASGPGFTLVSTDKTMGNPKAKVVLIEYGAPSCSICAYFFQNEFPKLKANYIDTGKIFYVFRVFPLRELDGDSEKMARCLPEDKYFTFIDQLWRNQPKWDNAEYPGITDAHAALVQQGRIAGMTSEQVDQCINNKNEDDRINKVAAEAEQRYSINATPTFILDGTPLSAGSVPYDQLSKDIDAEIAKKK
ncbi:MAG TPA: thioredoxin domain-containing protein [Rhizomicrobium sp.]